MAQPFLFLYRLRVTEKLQLQTRPFNDIALRKKGGGAKCFLSLGSDLYLETKPLTHSLLYLTGQSRVIVLQTLAKTMMFP